MKIVEIDLSLIKSQEDIFKEFWKVFWFPNWCWDCLDAFYDCLLYLNIKSANICSFEMNELDNLYIKFKWFLKFSKEYPELYSFIINWIILANKHRVNVDNEEPYIFFWWF